ncbi:hypothetical protein GCM10027421_17250 [Microbacterium shaanxiense]
MGKGVPFPALGAHTGVFTQSRGAQMSYRIGYFVGSLSSRSINRVLSKALMQVAPDELEFAEIPIGDLPL